MAKFALISCSKVKKDYPCPAKEMYMESQLFRKAIHYIEKQDFNDWYILSAKYGLLNKETFIEPYDVTLNNMNAGERKELTENVYKQILKLEPLQLYFYAGKKYREYLIPLLEKKGIQCYVPLEGLGIGEQLSFYKVN
ncbi:DUF6884 domain-containing protein [Bacillus sp. OTU2372]|uniref:DUF6884 domain-containing protein n=1 Tax=Bacillus sp. OTU2372 TaxID=3043858 RepID=UPI00313F09CF